MTTLASPGFFGKLPSRGDFVSRRTSSDFSGRWDAWLQACVGASRAALGDAWLDVYLTSPIWRFALAPGVCGEQAQLGVLMPSVDKVGRYFPLAAVVACDGAGGPLAVAAELEPWYAQVETLMLATLAETPLELEDFDRRLAALVPSAPAAAECEAAEQGAVNERGEPRHLRVAAGRTLREALLPLGIAALETAGSARSFWWTQGSERVEPCMLLAHELPSPDAFVALLDGEWRRHGWRSEVIGGAAAPPARLVFGSVAVRSAAVSNTGKVRERNEDACASRDDLGVWAVADGLGGHEAGAIASGMVASVVAGLEPGRSFDERLERLLLGLGVVNGCLRVLAERDPAVTLAGSTVAALLIEGAAAAYVWVGDSRVYRWREAGLEQLSRDHSEAAEGADNHVITRAVGGRDSLEAESERTDARPGDRFLLCTDGVYGEVGTDEIAAALALADPEQACAYLERAVLAGEAADNFTAVVVCIDGAEGTRAV